MISKYYPYNPFKYTVKPFENDHSYLGIPITHFFFLILIFSRCPDERPRKQYQSEEIHDQQIQRWLHNHFQTDLRPFRDGRLSIGRGSGRSHVLRDAGLRRRRRGSAWI